jgi:hypothetical protein
VCVLYVCIPCAAYAAFRGAARVVHPPRAGGGSGCGALLVARRERGRAWGRLCGHQLPLEAVGRLESEPQRFLAAGEIVR